MADPEVEKTFKNQLLLLIADIKENTGEDPETTILIGSAAAKLLDDTGAKDWPTFKSLLSREAYDGLLKSCDDDANDAITKGNHAIAYAVKTIAMSVIASRMTDPSTATGNELLDTIITRDIEIFRGAKDRAKNTPSTTRH